MRDGQATATAEIEAAGIFIFVGLAPERPACLNGAVTLAPDGRIPTDAAMRTALRGVAASGAVRAGWAGRAAARRATALPPRLPLPTIFVMIGGAMAELLTVHDPRGYPPKVTGKRLAPRLDSLDGKTVYLVDCLFDNSEVFMDQLQRLVRAAPARGRNAHHQAARKLGRRPRTCAAKIAAEGDAAILGVGL